MQVFFDKFKGVLCVGATVLTAALVSLGMHVFIYPNDFAPSGVDGLAAMLQKVTGLNAGLFTLAINLPLLVVAWFVLRRRYVLYTLLYTIFLSLFLFTWESVGFYRYVAESDRLLPALFGGVAQGLTGIMLRLGASSGGVDVMGSMVQKAVPHRDVEKIIALISIATVALSLPVYGQLQSALLSIVEIFVCERTTAVILKSSRNAVKFEVVTENPEALSAELLRVLEHGATLIPARGLYTDTEKSVIVCVVGYRQIPDFLRTVARYPGTFAYYSDVMGVRGSFRRRDPFS